MAKIEKGLSRREFARKAALGGAAALLPLPEVIPSSVASTTPDFAWQEAAGGAKLSAQSQAEVESRHQAILTQYPERFSDAQKADLKRLCVLLQPSLDHLRAYEIKNSDLPGLYLKPLVDRDKKPVTAADGGKTASAAPAKPATAAPGKP